MNRRAFLRLLGGAAASATLDRKYFFAPAAGWNPELISVPMWQKLKFYGVGRAKGAILWEASARYSVEEIALLFQVPLRLFAPVTRGGRELVTNFHISAG